MIVTQKSTRIINKAQQEAQLEAEHKAEIEAAEGARVSFDLSPEDTAAVRKVCKSYRELEPSVSQVSKMLLKLGLEAWNKRDAQL